MLSEREVKLVLAAAMAYDNRDPGQGNVAAWSEAARRGRWTLPEALEAVHQYYATETAWLMPGHVAQAIRTARQDAAMRAPQEPAPDPLGEARLAELTAGAFRAITDGEDAGASNGARRRGLSRPCSYCCARPGEPCTRRGLVGRVRLAKVHPARLEAS